VHVAGHIKINLVSTSCSSNFSVAISWTETSGEICGSPYVGLQIFLWLQVTAAKWQRSRFLVLEATALLHSHQACRHGRHLPPPRRDPSVSADSAATSSPASAGRLRGLRIPSPNRRLRPPWLQVRYPTYHNRTPWYRWDWLEIFSSSFVLAVVVCLVNPTAWLDPSTPVHIFPRRRWRKKGDQSIRVVFHPFCKFAAYVVHVLQKTSARMVCSLPLSLQRFSIYGWEQHRLFDMNNSMLHVVLISDRGQIFQFRYPPL